MWYNVVENILTQDSTVLVVYRSKYVLSYRFSGKFMACVYRMCHSTLRLSLYTVYKAHKIRSVTNNVDYYLLPHVSSEICTFCVYHLYWGFYNRSINPLIYCIKKISTFHFKHHIHISKKANITNFWNSSLVNLSYNIFLDWFAEK